MALVISSENYKNNNIGPDDGGLQPRDASQLKNMRLNNGAPTRNSSNNDVINYDNKGEENLFQDRVVSTDNGVNTTYTTARDATYFALHGTKDSSDIDNNTEIGNVTEVGKFHYVAPQNKVVTDSSKVVWDDKGTEEDESDDTFNNEGRLSEINKIYMVGSVNAMSAR